jgi:hypothetical protein
MAPLGGQLFAWRLARLAMIERAHRLAERLADCSQLGEGLVRVKGFASAGTGSALAMRADEGPTCQPAMTHE